MKIEVLRRGGHGELASLIKACGCNPARLPTNSDALLAVLEGPRVKDAQDVVVARNGGGSPAGYGVLFVERDLDASFLAFNALDAHFGTAGRALLAHCLTRARELGLGGLRVNACREQVAAGRALAAAGFEPARSFYEMRLSEKKDMDGGPAMAHGVEFRPMERNELEKLREVQNGAFEGSYGFSLNSVEDLESDIGGAHLAPERVLFAVASGQVAGYVFHKPDDIEGGRRVEMMGVLEPWRGRGLGKELLRRAAAAAFDTGVRQVTLMVDAANTPAVKLYERLGFATRRVIVSWRRGV